MSRMVICGLGLVLATTYLHLQAAPHPTPVPGARAAQTADAQPLSASDASTSDSQRALLKRYCVTCHNQKLKTGGLMLDQADRRCLG